MNDKFASGFVGGFEQFLVFLFVEYELCDAVSVSQVDEGHASHFAGSLNPAGEGHLLAFVLESETSAVNTSVHGLKTFRFSYLMSYIYNKEWLSSFFTFFVRLRAPRVVVS